MSWWMLYWYNKQSLQLFIGLCIKGTRYLPISGRGLGKRNGGSWNCGDTSMTIIMILMLLLFVTLKNEQTIINSIKNHTNYLQF